MDRRRFLGMGAGLVGVGATAGCLSGFALEQRSTRAPPLVENRPNAVYYPTHVEGMAMAGMADAGPYKVALTYSYPHRFWVVTGRNRKQVEIGSDDSVHLMASLWDPETGIVPPTASTAFEIVRDGETVVEKPPWPMLSQNMGFHFGDNVALPGNGSYEVTIRIDPMQTRRTGAFQGRFGESAVATVPLEFDRKELQEIAFTLLPEQQGQRGAVEPMEMDMVPIAQLPPAGDLPGRVVGEASTGDGVFVVTALSEPPAGIDGDGPYLAASARTPYNRYPLPFMAVSGRLSRGGSTVFEGALAPTLDPDLHYHYGATVDSLESGDELELSVGAPPQIARHEGYETAFFDMGSMRLSVP